jgi:hypothetical protein
MMIDNPIVPRKHPYEFKAVIPYRVLFEFIEIVDKYDRRNHTDTFIYTEEPGDDRLLDLRLEEALNL